MLPPQLILVKHSQPAIRPGVDARDWHLSEIGRERCARLAEHLRVFQPAVLFSSDEPKAMETAQILAANWDQPSTVIPNLHEHDRRGEPYFSDSATFEANIANFFAQPDKRVYGNETAHQALSRFTKAVEQVLSQSTATPIVITHGTVITLFVAAHNEMNADAAFEFWKSLALPSVIALNLPDFKLITPPSLQSPPATPTR